MNWYSKASCFGDRIEQLSKRILATGQVILAQGAEPGAVIRIVFQQMANQPAPGVRVLQMSQRAHVLVIPLAGRNESDQTVMLSGLVVQRVAQLLPVLAATNHVGQRVFLS